MKRWGKKRYSAGSRFELESLDAAPSLALAVAVPTMPCGFGDDLLLEIDGLLRDHDALVGFWQAGGE